MLDPNPPDVTVDRRGLKRTRRDQVQIMEAWIDNVTMDEALQRVEQLMVERDFSYTVTPNVDHLIKLREDEDFRKVYALADLIVPDGVPLLWASRVLGTALKERVNGTDMFLRLSALSAERGYAVYLLGGAPGSAAATARILEERFPGVVIAGHACPPLGFHEVPEQNAAVIDAVARAQPDLLFVGLGAPKQEKWISTYGRLSGARHAVGIGGSFSMVSGAIQRAPEWAQRSGLEWMWRLAHEPERLWKRYLIEDLPFVRYLGSEFVRSRFRR